MKRMELTSGGSFHQPHALQYDWLYVIVCAPGRRTHKPIYNGDYLNGSDLVVRRQVSGG